MPSSKRWMSWRRIASCRCRRTVDPPDAPERLPALIASSKDPFLEMVESAGELVGIMIDAIDHMLHESPRAAPRRFATV